MGKLLVICALFLMNSFSTDATNKIRAVNLGGWLVVEEWMSPSIFEGMPNGDMRDGTQIQLKSVTLGTYVVAEDGGGSKIAVDRSSASGWEMFKLWRIRDSDSHSQFHLRVNNGQFMTAENGGGSTMVASRTSSPSGWEAFFIYRDPNSKNVHLKAFNGMYVQAKDKTQLTADWEGEPDWGTNAATFEMTIVSSLGGQYQLDNGWGSNASSVVKKHWDTFITEDDFKFLASNGINAVRIPIGWWIKESTPPFVDGSLQVLDNAFSWGRTHNIKIIIDLHAAEGSQSGQEHAGTRDGVAEWGKANTDYVSHTLDLIEFLASRYASNDALLGIELLNEPNVYVVSLDTLNQYYKDGYERIRKHSNTAYVIMCQRIGADPIELVNLMNPDQYQNVVLDVHWYNLFEDKFNEKSVQWNIDWIKTNKSSDLEKLINAGGASIFIGEWVNEWKVNGATNTDYQTFGNAQLEVYGQATFGWSYWSIKIKHDQLYVHWDFEYNIKNGLLQKNSNGNWP